jgi:hypothetical protein
MTTRAMSPLRQRMLEDMQLRGLSARTQEAYSRAVWQLAQHYHRSPKQLSDEDLRQYFLYLTNEKKLARPTTTIALCGLKFFYQQTLKQPWPTLSLLSPGPTAAHRPLAAPTKGPAMTLNLALLTHTDTSPPALACFTPSLATLLSAIRVCAELKPVCRLKTIPLPLQLPIHLAKICCDLPNFHRR